MKSRVLALNTKLLMLLVVITLACESIFAGTDLGELGNSYVNARFESYKAKNPNGQCVRNRPDLPSAILTGFGIFNGITYNISGEIVKNASGSIQDPQAATPYLDASDYGGRALTRVLELNHHEVEVCFLNLEVTWDLAASIILFESLHFTPSAILMMGRGFGQSVDFVPQANNVTSPSTGYDYSGKMLEKENSPKSKWILNTPGAPKKMPFRWNGKKLAKSVKSELSGSKYTVKYLGKADGLGGFICNSLGYTIGAALNGNEVRLAGGEIVFDRDTLKSTASFGFLHLPAVDAFESTLTESTLDNLTRLVLKTLSIMLIVQ